MKSLSPASLAPASLSPLSSSSSRSVSSLGTSAAPAPPAMPRKASSTPDSRLKWRKRKRKRIPDASASPLRAADHSEDSDSAAANDDDDMAVPSAAVDAAADEILAGAAARDPAPDPREAEVLSSAEIISAFPAATRRKVNRPHPSVLAVVAAERSAYVGDVSASVPPALENISHGQLQVLSGALPDHPSLSSNPDRPSSYVCTPPPLMEGHGVLKQFQGRLHVVPKHSDWFSPGTVHRLERQVVPHFFTGKSPGNTPEKFMMLRNKVIAKYLGNPGKRLAFAECQGLVVNTGELYDLSRIVRFLDAWGVINYLAVGLVHRGLRLAPSLLREEPAGELQLLTAPLKSIDGLILFDRPKCSLRAEDIALLASSPSNPEVVGFDAGAEFAELEGKIRERLSEGSCSYCSQSLRSLHYQSQKEVDIALCSSCFHDSRYITGHSSLDFQRANGDRNGSENDGDNWTDRETLLLLEGIEKHNDNWNSIADHVGTKSKAQCIYHFIRLPVEDSLLENIEVPDASMPFRAQTNGHPHSDSNGNLPQSIQHGNQLPFISSSNPVMSLVAFLASAIGPRIAASCASAALSALTRDDDPRVISESMHADDRTHGAHPKFRDHNGASSSSISPENVKHAALWGLSAAAMKSKLFADQEEREIQRLSATVINHQLKRLELKLKQFAEVETLLLKECEQVERARQRISAGRMQVMSGRLNPAGSSRPNGGSSTIASNPINMSPRPVAAPGSMAEATIPAASANNMHGQGHPQMPFLQRQPQMLSFGPRLPLSAIQTQPSAQASNIMFSSAAMPNSVTPSHNHQLLRSSSGNNSSLG